MWYPHVCTCLQLMPSNYQTKGLHALVRNKDTPRHEFVFYSDRLLRLVRAPPPHPVIHLVAPPLQVLSGALQCSTQYEEVGVGVGVRAIAHPPRIQAAPCALPAQVVEALLGHLPYSALVTLIRAQYVDVRLVERLRRLRTSGYTSLHTWICMHEEHASAGG